MHSCSAWFRKCPKSSFSDVQAFEISFEIINISATLLYSFKVVAPTPSLSKPQYKHFSLVFKTIGINFMNDVLEKTARFISRGVNQAVRSTQETPFSTSTNSPFFLQTFPIEGMRRSCYVTEDNSSLVIRPIDS